MPTDSFFAMVSRFYASRRCHCGDTMGLPGWSKGWPVDEETGRTTFLRIPESINIDLPHEPDEQNHVHRKPANLTNLPSELKWTILSLLPAIDRVCLAVTCKTLAASALVGPHLRATSWTPWLNTADIYDDLFPSRNQLIQRLAHGWIDKSHLRYCQSCYLILPRDSQYWWKKLCKKKTIPWDVKVRVEKEKWKKLSKKKRFDHIIKLWCEAQDEDSSVFSCRLCVRTRILGLDNPATRDLEKGLGRNGVTTIPQVPVECPACIEHSLTNRWKEPRKPKVRPFLWKWTKKTLSFCGNAMLVLIYLIYLLLKAPLEVGLWLWKKYKGNKPRLRRAITMLCSGKQTT